MGRSFFSRATLEKRLPIVGWAPKYNLADLEGDVLAGFTVGLTVIPQGIAYAIVAGAQPTYGLYSAFVGCFVYMIFGSAKDITIGPTAIMSIMTHTYTANLACYSDDIAVLLAFLSGSIILVATFFRLGFLITFIGRPVISGFTSAAAITIATGQIKGLFGIKVNAESFIDKWRQIYQNIGEMRYQDAVLGLSSVAVLLGLRSVNNLVAAKPLNGDPLSARIWKKAIFLTSVARNALVVIIGGLLAYCLREHEPFSVTGDIEAGFPRVSLPTFTLHCNTSNSTTGEDVYGFGQILSMLGSGPAIVPLIAILESIAIASAFSHGKAIDATQEMLALGLCNLVGSFFQSIPTTGSFSRTAVNASSGVRTPAGGFTTGLLVILALLFFTPAFKYIPKPTLAAVIICAVIFSVEFYDIKPMWKTYRWDHIPLWVTFFVCLLWSLEWGILIGAAIHVCMLLYLQATPIVTVVLRESPCGTHRVVVVQPAYGLQFPNSKVIKKRLSQACEYQLPLLVVLDCAHVTVVDYTAALAIRSLCTEFSDRKQRVAFANMCTRVRDSLLALSLHLEEVDLPSIMNSLELPLNLVEEGKESLEPLITRSPSSSEFAENEVVSPLMRGGGSITPGDSIGVESPSPGSRQCSWKANNSSLIADTTPNHVVTTNSVEATAAKTESSVDDAEKRCGSLNFVRSDPAPSDAHHVPTSCDDAPSFANNHQAHVYELIQDDPKEARMGTARSGYSV